MHSVIVSAKVDESIDDPEYNILREQLVPAAQALPGAITGYWHEVNDDRVGAAVVVFDSEESARQAVAAMHVEVGSSIVPGIFVDVQVREVVGHF